MVTVRAGHCDLRGWFELLCWRRYERALVPWKHYVPVNDFDKEDIVQVRKPARSGVMSPHRLCRVFFFKHNSGKASMT